MSRNSDESRIPAGYRPTTGHLRDQVERIEAGVGEVRNLFVRAKAREMSGDAESLRNIAPRMLAAARQAQKLFDGLDLAAAEFRDAPDLKERAKTAYRQAARYVEAAMKWIRDNP